LLRNPDLIQRKNGLTAEFSRGITGHCDIGGRMKALRDSLAAVVFFCLVLLFIEAAVAAPMRCSGEQKTCITACNKSLDKSLISTCVTNCGLRQSLCMKTGCWDTGFQKYCGLLKQ
jgi:hypothetical protein